MEQGVTECRREMERLFGNGDDLVRELRYMESQMQVGVPVESGRSIGREDTGHRGDSGSDRRKEAGTAGDEYGSGSDDPLYAGDFQRISGCLIS